VAEMSGLISDDIMQAIAVMRPRHEVAAALRERLTGLVDAASLVNSRTRPGPLRRHRGRLRAPMDARLSPSPGWPRVRVRAIDDNCARTLRRVAAASPFAHTQRSWQEMPLSLREEDNVMLMRLPARWRCERRTTCSCARWSLPCCGLEDTWYRRHRRAAVTATATAPSP